MYRRYRLIEPRGQFETLGEGAYGVVYMALDLEDDERRVALKKIKLEHAGSEGMSSSALREITLLRLLRHKNIVSLENVVMEPERLSLIFELMDTDLSKYLKSCRHDLPPKLIRSYSKQLLSGVAYCHSMGVMHRDLKPQNILLAQNGTLKIADFGLARNFTPIRKTLTVEVITRWYRAPEVLLGHTHYDCSVDLWSVGCIIAEMSNKTVLFPGMTEIDQIHKIFKFLGTPTEDDWPDLISMRNWRQTFPRWNALRWDLYLSKLEPTGIDLLSHLLECNPARRWTASDSLLHPYFVRRISPNVSRKIGSPSYRPVSAESLTSSMPIETKTSRGEETNDRPKISEGTSLLPLLEDNEDNEEEWGTKKVENKLEQEKLIEKDHANFSKRKPVNKVSPESVSEKSNSNEKVICHSLNSSSKQVEASPESTTNEEVTLANNMNHTIDFQPIQPQCHSRIEHASFSVTGTGITNTSGKRKIGEVSSLFEPLPRMSKSKIGKVAVSSEHSEVINTKAKGKDNSKSKCTLTDESSADFTTEESVLSVKEPCASSSRSPSVTHKKKTLKDRSSKAIHELKNSAALVKSSGTVKKSVSTSSAKLDRSIEAVNESVPALRRSTRHKASKKP